MTVLRGVDLAKSFGIRTLFRDGELTVATGERVGFVGANGAGKTTFLRCLVGELEFDRGHIGFDGPAVTGYVEQQAELTGETVYDAFLDAFADIRRLAAQKQALEKQLAADHSPELLAEYEKILNRFEHLEGYDYESRIRRVAFGLGFTESDFSRPADKLSGGQKTRVLLARALLREPDFLYLDEPTNHLDIVMIEWLEEYLRAYRGGVFLISHDRMFLDRVATKIVELADQTLTTYGGNYSYYLKVRDARRAALESAYAKQQEHIRKTEEYIRRFKAGIKAKQARGRQSQLDRLERIILPPREQAFDFFAFSPPAECAERVLETENLAFGYGGEPLLKDLSLLIRRGEGVALIGPNGIGKTTLLKLVVGELEPTAGRLKLGSRVQVGYFSQEHEDLHPELTVLDEIFYSFDLDEEQSRRYLGAFLFHGDDVLKKVGELSGGEAARLAFLKLMLTGANFLILDEPTNHLDIPAKEAIETALMTFPGTFLVVSHDRYFLNRVTNRTLEFQDGVITSYDGPYDYYHAKKLETADPAAGRIGTRSGPTGETALPPKAAKPPRLLGSETPPATKPKKSAAPAPAKTAAPKAKEIPPPDAEKLARAEARIAMCEAELKMLEREMNDPALQSDPAKSAALAAEYAAKEAELEQRYAEWGALTGDN